MSDNDRKKKEWIPRVLFSVIFIAADFVAIYLYKNGLADFDAYRTFSRELMHGVSDITGLIPISLWDFLVVILAVQFIRGLVRMIVRKKLFFNFISKWILAGSVIFTLVLGGWLLNHYGPALSDILGMDIREYSEDELYEATAYYFDRAAEYSELQKREADGTLVRPDFYDLAKVAGASYKPLASENELFDGATSRVKKLVLYGNPLLVQGYTGIFMPLTAEANVPANEASASMAFTMCHEAAHRLGIAAEEEANFCAFLACDASEDLRLKYSGYYMAFIYCYNKLYEKNYDRLYALLREKEVEERYALILRDADDQRKQHEKYKNEKVEKVSDQVYDHYLKSFGEEDGLQSYGEVVDELISWYLENGKK